MLIFRLLILYLFLGNIEVFSQITLYQSDYAIVGDTVISANDTVAPVGVSIGGTGLQTWNFLGLQNLFTDTVFYQNPQNTPNAAEYLNSNLVAEDSIRMVYQSVTSAEVTLDGHVSADPFGAGFTVAVEYSPMQKILEFPMTDGSTFQDTFSSVTTIETVSLGLPVPNIDSIRQVHFSYTTSIVDAYGTMDIPGGSYNSIRQLYTEITFDSVFMYCSDAAGCDMFVAILPFGWSFVPSQISQLIVGVDNPVWETIPTYRWWAKGSDQAIVELEMDALMTQIVRSRYKIGGPATAIEPTSPQSEINVYPNPSEGVFKVELDGIPSEEVRLQLKNYLGQVVYSEPISLPKGQAIVAIGIDDLPRGIYILEVRLGTERLARKVIIQ